MEKKKDVLLSSAESVKNSLEAISRGRAGLSERRKKLLERVPHSGDWVIVQKQSVTTKDILYNRCRKRVYK